MFSLIIVLVSIALVVALVAATIYYGGSSSASAQVRTAAATLINQGSQINAAGMLAVSQGPGWPAASPQFAQPYLSSMPVPPKSAYADQSETPVSSHWTYYVDPASPSSAHHFVLKNKISAEVCMAVNRVQGVIGIPAVWDGTTLIQCFGAGVAAGAGKPLGYTFFYDPVGSTAALDLVALDQSKTEGGSTTAGYPRLCPDGSTITTGLCLDTASSGGGGSGSGGAGAPSPVPSTNTYTVTASTSVFDATGADSQGQHSWVDYCSSNVSAGSFTADSTMTVGGVSVPIAYTFEEWGKQCVELAAQPASASVGAQPVVISNSDGTIVYGSVTYVSAFSEAPTLTSISPSPLEYYEPATVVITGAGFQPGTTAALANTPGPVTVTYIDSTHIRLLLPPAGVNTDADLLARGYYASYTQTQAKNSLATDRFMGYQDNPPPGNTYNFVPTIGLTDDIVVTNPGSRSALITVTYLPFWTVLEDSLYPSNSEPIYPGSWVTFCSNTQLLLRVGFTRVNDLATRNIFYQADHEGLESCLETSIPEDAVPGPATMRYRVMNTWTAYAVQYPDEYDGVMGVDSSCPACTELRGSFTISAP